MQKNRQNPTLIPDKNSQQISNKVKLPQFDKEYTENLQLISYIMVKTGCSPKSWKKVRVSSLSTLLQNCTGNPS